MNAAPRAPSSTRWSHDSVMVIIGRTPMPPAMATTRSPIAPTARIPACGGTMMAVNESTLYIPRLLIVQVAPAHGDVAEAHAVGLRHDADDDRVGHGHGEADVDVRVRLDGIARPAGVHPRMPAQRLCDDGREQIGVGQLHAARALDVGPELLPRR